MQAVSLAKKHRNCICERAFGWGLLDSIAHCYGITFIEAGELSLATGGNLEDLPVERSVTYVSGTDKENLERETGFEPATSTLARSHSTTELLPLGCLIINKPSLHSNGTFMVGQPEILL